MFITENFVLRDFDNTDELWKRIPNGMGSEIYEKVDATRLLFKS